MNRMLAEVRSLSIIVHIVMMQLLFPALCVLFFESILGFVNFDVIPTEDIYAELFGWLNVPYSDQAEVIGYESRYIIECLGSIPIYITCNILMQILYCLLKLIFK